MIAQHMETLNEIFDTQNIMFDDINIDGVFNLGDPTAFTAGSQTNADTLTQSQMLKAFDNDKFVDSQVPEIEGLAEAEVFEYLPMEDKPHGTRLLNSIWSYRCKCRPDGSLLKHKSRICVDGSRQQHGIDYWDTYCPVVHWSTVRMMLVLSAILGLKSRQVDYTQAFPQAPLDDPVFMRIPQGWSYDATLKRLVQSDDPAHSDCDHYIRLRRNLYGCKQAARNWYLHLKAGLEQRGFVPSKIDPCLYIRKDCIIALYTDDCLIFANDDSTIDELCESLSSDFLLKDEGELRTSSAFALARLLMLTNRFTTPCLNLV